MLRATRGAEELDTLTSAARPPPWKSWEWNTQTITFVISLAVQLAVLIFSLVTLGMGSPPPVLRIILTLETVVQGVELTWYTGIAIRFLCGYSTGVWARYIDWTVTCPTMLLSFYFLVLYFANECMTASELTDTPRFVPYVVVIVLMDWLMLALGFVYEIDLCSLQASAWGRWPLIVGFVPLLLSFLPHFDALASDPTWEGYVVVFANLLAWSIYGIVSIVFFGRGGAEAKNSAFNLLDLFSKNAAGLVVSVVALAFNQNTCV